MKIWLPIVGTILSREPLMGDPADPVRFRSLEEQGYRPEAPVTLSLVRYDLDRGHALIQVEASEECKAWIRTQGIEIEQEDV